MNYIKHIRQYVGHEILFTVGCGVIIEKDGKILLQHRIDEDCWGIPGGVMEIGESFEQTAIRETNEETGLKVRNLQLFGMYSGESCFVEYPNKDKMYSVQIIFKTSEFTGDLIQSGEESRVHKFFGRDELPININSRQKSFIKDWAQSKRFPVIS